MEANLILMGLYVLGFLAGIFVLYFLQRKKPNGGRNFFTHLIYWAVAVAIIVFHPHTIGDKVLSGFGCFVIGIVFPGFMSLKALMTPEADDDARWLMYWVVFSAFTFLTEWIDVISQYFDFWYELQFFILIWFQLPFTDGLNLCYDFVVVPLMRPVFRKVDEYMGQSWLLLWTMLATVNLTMLGMVLVVLFVMPDLMTTFLITCVGVAYPVLNSMKLLAKRDEDGTFGWLMYWVAFCLVRLSMEFVEELEAYLDEGALHRLLLVVTVWLQLPLTKGAEVLFRSVLVPLAGLQAELCVLDVRRALNEAGGLHKNKATHVGQAAEAMARSLLLAAQQVGQAQLAEAQRQQQLPPPPPSQPAAPAPAPAKKVFKSSPRVAAPAAPPAAAAPAAPAAPSAPAAALAAQDPALKKDN